MITADADFIISETSQTLRPIFDAYFSPYFYPVDIADGTFVNCRLQSADTVLAGPLGFGDEGFGDVGWGLGLLGDVEYLTLPSGDRIVIDYGATSASWTSLIITNPAEIMPATPIPTWDINHPGYSYVAQYRTSNNYNQVSTLSWSTLTESAAVSLYRYYQIRFVWTAIRAWIFKTPAGAEASPYSFYFVPSTPDASASYFCPGDGIISYLDDLVLEGEYQINPDDVMDMGELSEELGGDFGKVVAGEHTMILINRDDKFTAGHDNFIFKEDNWYRKGLRLAMGYQQGGTPINIFKGTVCKWGPRPERIDPDCVVSEPTIEVYSKSLPMKLLERQIGVTDDDGIPHPWVCGEILHEMTQLADESMVPPEKTALIVTDFSATDISGAGNTLTDSSSVQIKGSDSIASHVENLNVTDGKAIGRLDLNLPSNKLLLSAWIRFDDLPEAIKDKQMGFMGFLLSNNQWGLTLVVGADSKVWLYYSGQSEETSWYLNQDLGVFKRISIALCALGTVGGVDCGVMKVYVNGDEVYSKTGDFSSLAAMRSGFAGAWINLQAQTWDMYIGDVELSTGWEPYAYRLPGYPYQSLGTIYQDGAIKQEIRKTPTPGSWAQPKTIKDYFCPTYVPGTTLEETLVVKNSRLGLIICQDYANPPSGTIFIRARKDDNNHPADVIEALLIEAGLSSAVNSTSFNAYKTDSDLANDSIGCWFEDTTLADAMAAIGSRCLVNILATLDTVRLLPYKGVAGASVATIANWVGYDHSIEMEDITSRVKVKWGWFERNNNLTYIAKDTVAIAQVGQKDLEIDFTWGQEVASDSQVMAENKADWCLKRVKGGRELLEDFAQPYSQARLEVGDTVTVTSDRLFNTPNFLLISKSMKMSPDYELTFEAVKYLGE